MLQLEGIVRLGTKKHPPRRVFAGDVKDLSRGGTDLRIGFSMPPWFRIVRVEVDGGKHSLVDDTLLVFPDDTLLVFPDDTLLVLGIDEFGAEGFFGIVHSSVWFGFVWQLV